MHALYLHPALHTAPLQPPQQPFHAPPRRPTLYAHATLALHPPRLTSLVHPDFEVVLADPNVVLGERSTWHNAALCILAATKYGGGG